MRKNTMILSLGIAIILLAIVAPVSAYQKLCMGYGESVPSEENPRFTCYHDICQVCVTDQLFPTLPNRCNDIEGCVPVGAANVDGNPPVLTIFSPDNDEVYNSRKVILDLISNEPCSLYHIDNINGRGRWSRLSSNMDSYIRGITFEEGFNNITIRCIDRSDNEALVERHFYVDSKEPKIRRTYPKTEFVSSEFTVEYDEENVISVKLHYGNDDRGYQENELTGCQSGKKQSCTIDVDLSLYDGEEIEYWFEVRDIANNTDESRPVSVKVDETSPVINSLNFEKDGKYVYFDIDITESFFDEVTYIDNLDPKGREKRLCNKLDNGICEKKVSFKDGDHDITIYVTDEVGHKVGQSVQFFTDSKDPKIKKTNPKSGYANGDFDVEFIEENPALLEVHYGNVDVGYRDKELNLSECVEGKRGFFCEESVDLGDYDGQEIEYWFYLEDKVGNSVESRPYSLDVDITYPVLNNLTYEVDGRYVYFTFDITEENFDEVIFSDNGGRWRRLCNRLDENGMCEKKKPFSRGDHDIDIQIIDDAGNSIAENIDLDINY